MNRLVKKGGIGLVIGMFLLFIFVCVFGVVLPKEKMVFRAVPYFGQPTLPIKNLQIGSTTLQVEIAHTNETRMSGLSNRPYLKEGAGMFFEFEQDGRYSFWMKEMKFPIDILWFDSERRVVYVVSEAMPDSYPSLFTPTRPARFVLEVPAGFATRHNIVVGDSFEFVEVVEATQSK